jgi:lipoate-protein ligase B
VYPIFPLKQFEVGLEDYLSGLHQVLLNVLASHDIPAQTRPEQVGVWVNDRAIAHLGVAVWDWFAYFGFYLNVSPDPGPFRMMRTGDDLLPMTTMIRESRSERIRETRVRQELLTEFAKVFKLERVSVFHHHPGLTSKVPIHAIPAGPH